MFVVMTCATLVAFALLQSDRTQPEKSQSPALADASLEPASDAVPSKQAEPRVSRDQSAPPVTTAGINRSAKPASPPTPQAPASTEGTPPPPPAEPAAPDAPSSVRSLACVSGDMVDVITFDAPTEGAVTGYTLLRAVGDTEEFEIVSSADDGARSFTFAVSECAAARYRVFATGPGGKGPADDTVTNDRVAMSADVPPSGATLRASNGEVVLVLPAEAYLTTTTVTVDEISGTPTGGIVSLAGVYEVSPSGPLGASATLSIAYSLAVTHHQVSDVLLKASGLMTWDDAARSWVAGAADVVAQDGYLTGTLDHFSYWTGAAIQPHGTSPATVSYCSGICHDLATYPGSTVRYATRDPQVCYNCHGNANPALPPAGSTGENVQASITGPGAVSKHPVANGSFYCTACHDPHANPASSPGLLRAWNPSTGSYIQGGGATAPGTEFCWTCHGSTRNRRIEVVVPGYFTRTGGDKKTRFVGGAHSAGNAATQRLDSASELERGVRTRVAVNPGGAVTLPVGSIALPKDATPVTSRPPLAYSPPMGTTRVMYDADGVSAAYWGAAEMGATSGNGWRGDVAVTVDLGALVRLESFTLQTISSTYAGDVVAVQGSPDNASWTSLASQGTLGTRLPATVTLNGSMDARYVRFTIQRDFSANTNGSMYVSELTVRGQPYAGTYEMRVDIPRAATYAGGVVRWQAATPAGTAVEVRARGSFNNGASWTAWQPVANGGSLTQLSDGLNLQSALLEVNATLSTTVLGQTPTLDWLEVTTMRGAITGAPPTAEPIANECQRCHVPHGSTAASLVLPDGTAACTTCHQTPYGGTYFGAEAFSASAHTAVDCTGCHGSHGTPSGPNGIYGFLLPDTRQELCFSCHAEVQAAFDANQGPASEFAKHDIYAPEQAKWGSRIRCGNCHSVHSPTGLVDPDSITTPFSAYRDDPTSIPTQQLVVYASKDTVIDSDAPTMNFGAATTATLDSSNRLLLYFDLSGVPAGATIKHASLVLWTTSTPSGGYNVYPLARDWLEGNAVGAVNSSSIDGATWLEWKYGDNANTGSVASGDWATAGGDLGAHAASNTAASSNTSVNVTQMVASLRTGPNYGIAVTTTSPSSSFATYFREHATAQYRPKLRIVYQTGPATRQVLDDLAFCLKCHDGTMPMGLRGQSMTWIAGAYAGRPHGAAQGLGPESRTHSTDGGGGGLKAPYYYGMDALPCVTCHDPHGSSLPFHLREVVNGRDMAPLRVEWGYSNVIKAAMGMSSVPSTGWFCGACHIYPSTHNRENQTGCAPCHGHSGSRGG